MENYFSANNIDHGSILGPFDYSVIVNWTYGSTRNISSGFPPEFAVDPPQSTLSPLGAATAALVTFLLTSSHGSFNIKHVVDYQSMLLGAVIMVMLILTLPFLAILVLYRCAVFCLLKVGSCTFISLMEGPDAVWNLKDSSQPIITVLAEIESEEADCLLKAIREAILKAVLVNPKLAWKRKHSCMGYSYWQTYNDLSFLKEHIHWMPQDSQNFKDHITLTELQSLISNISHQGLLDDNTCWEILVSKQRLMTNKEFSSVYPVLFRIHHSLGDGVSLLELLMKSLSDVGNKQLQISTCTLNTFSIIKEKVEYTSKHFKYNNIVGLMRAEGCRERENFNTEEKEIALRQETRETLARKENFDQINYNRGVTEVFISEGRIRFDSNQEVFKHQQKKALFSSLGEIINFLRSFGNNIQFMWNIIYSLKKIKLACETSILDVNKISGKKLIAWHTDSPQGYTFSCVKRIKSQNKGARFTDVVLTALSRTIEKYLKDKNVYIPNCISVVVPIYVKPYSNYHSYKTKSSITTKTNQKECKNILEYKEKTNFHYDRTNNINNSFSLGIMNLPINSGYNSTYISHLKKVSRNMNFMHQSGQFELNSFILKWVANLLPAPLLKKFLQLVGHNTMVISNLLGPTDTLYLAGYPLKNICFWVPQRANTAISVSILSYCSRLQIGIMIDRSIMNTSEEVQCLLEEAISEITKLADQNAHETGKGA